MTEPRTPDEPSNDVVPVTPSPAPVSSAFASSPPEDATPAPPPVESTAPPANAADPASAAERPDGLTQAWPTATASTRAVDARPTAPPSSAAAISPGPAFEPAPSLPSSRVETVAETGTFGAAGQARSGRSRLRWGLALLGVLIVAAASFLIVSLVGGRPATSTAMGYMPADVVTYEEIRLDLPGDQREKLAGFLSAFPSFKDQSAIDAKIDELFDRVVRAATKDSQTWTTDIKPWFGGQFAVGVGVPPTGATTNLTMSGAANTLAVLTISDRAKAIAWLTKTADNASINHTTYGDSDLFVAAGNGGNVALAVNDKVMIGGSTVAVKAAVDSRGSGTFAQNDDVKAALGTVDKDYVAFGVVRTRAYADAALKMMASAQPGVLDKTQLDETALGLIPAWQATTARFESDALVATTAGPSWSIGYDTANRPSEVVGHVPAKSILYVDIHDAGPVLNAVLAKFRALDETKAAFAQFDQALSLLGGADAAFGWWGDTAVVVSPLSDGTIGGGLVIHPRDAAAADRLLTTLAGFVAIGGGSSGVTTRTEDHNGTKITILDLSAVPGMSTSSLPAGYKPEFAWASNADVAVLGYGSAFVKDVLDAGAGNSLGDDARFKALVGRVGSDNMGVSFVDMAAIRTLVEPLMQAQLPADQWTRYTTDIQPYLKPLDAIIGAVHKDGSLDRGSGALTAH